MQTRAWNCGPVYAFLFSIELKTFYSNQKDSAEVVNSGDKILHMGA